MIGIVILNYNNAGQTIACLNSIYGTCPRGIYKICVVDNASKPEDLEELKSACNETILEATENRGYACGNDIGLEYFDKDDSIDSVLILNNDTILTEDILTPLYSYLKGHGNCGVVFPLVKSKSGETDPACLRRSKSTADLLLQATSLNRFGLRRKEFISEDEVKDLDGNWKIEDGAIITDVPPGSCMMLRKDVFKSIGWLDPHTFLYFEEHILSDKLKARGLSAALIPTVSIIHLGAQTTSRQPSRAVFRHWRNSYLYYLDNFTKTSFPIRQYLRFRTWLGLLIK